MSLGIFYAINNSTGTCSVTNWNFTNTVGISHVANLSNFGGSAAETNFNVSTSYNMPAGTVNSFTLYYNTSTAVGGTYVGSLQVLATMSDSSIEEENVTNYIYVAVSIPGPGTVIAPAPAVPGVNYTTIDYGTGGDAGGGGPGCSPGDTSNSCSADGGGAGGSKVICTELYRQRLLDKSTFLLDQEYGNWLLLNDPTTYWGYRAWADILVNYMRGHGRPFVLAFWLDKDKQKALSKKIAMKIAKIIAYPFANELARRVEKTQFRKFTITGWLIVEVGHIICKIIGLYMKRRKKHALKY